MSRAILISPRLKRAAYVPLPPERMPQTFRRYLRVYAVNHWYLDGLGMAPFADTLYTICTASAHRSAMADEGTFCLNGFQFQGRALIARDDGRRLSAPSITLNDLRLEYQLN